MIRGVVSRVFGKGMRELIKNMLTVCYCQGLLRKKTYVSSGQNMKLRLPYFNTGDHIYDWLLFLSSRNICNNEYWKKCFQIPIWALSRWKKPLPLGFTPFRKAAFIFTCSHLTRSLTVITAACIKTQGFPDVQVLQSYQASWEEWHF